MDQPWFRKIFRNPQKPPLESTQTKADNGDAEAQCSLGLSFANGEQTEPDYAQAIQWYLKSANQDYALAQFNLGIIFADGRGVPRDDAQAMLWISRAAEQGHPGAQHSLGARCRRASFKNPPKDAVESNLQAYKWFRLAAAQGHKGSDAAFESIALGLTREEVTEGDQLAAAFIPSCAKVVHA